MRTIEVDFDVYKALTARRPTEDVTDNDVLRELLRLPGKRVPVGPAAAIPSETDTWVSKGVRFPVGTEFRANYKGQTWLGRVERGALVVNGERFDSPSAAAVAITKSPANGWTFWESRLPGQDTWQTIKAMRRK